MLIAATTVLLLLQLLQRSDARPTARPSADDLLQLQATKDTVVEDTVVSVARVFHGRVSHEV